MKIVELKVANFKRLTAVTIKPRGNVVTIGGKNDSGKSSALDAIWSALGGADVMPTDPIHDGADEARIALDLGDMSVTRKIKRAEGQPPYTTTLVIENADGSRARSPQTLLNDLVGRYSLDPLEFSRFKPKEQFDALKVLVPGLDFDEIETLNRTDYEKRTAHNRKAKELRAAAAAVLVPPGKWASVDESSILADIARAGEHNAAISARKDRRTKVDEEAERLERRVMAAQDSIKALVDELSRMKEQARADAAEAEGLRKKLKDAPELPELLDTQHLAERLSAARATNANAEKNAHRIELERQAVEQEKISEALTESMAAREEQKRVAIADAKFPVEGLSLGAGEVLVDGHPFAQAATSKKIKTSVALAMAMNPKIRVIRISDGSLLDSESMQTIQEMAAASDFQIWVECVDEAGKSQVMIEDGRLKGAPT